MKNFKKHKIDINEEIDADSDPYYNCDEQHFIKLKSEHATKLVLDYLASQKKANEDIYWEIINEVCIKLYN